MVQINRPILSDALRLYVFDLDGTLIDSRADLVQSVNATLRHFHRHTLPDEVIASYIGDGAGMLVRRALGDPENTTLLDDALLYFLSYYREHKLDNTYVYDGIMPVLQALRDRPRGTIMAVLSNKPVGPSRAICEAFGLAPYFFRIYGGDSFATKKPDAFGLERLIHEAGVTPAETIMIGDSDVDILTAQNCGTFSVGCNYGLSPHTLETVAPDALVHTPIDLLTLLQ
ncbi:MAG TPA: HAD-IA family hydrolase [Acidobacteriaceae bacterium]|jgi:phosphoglycolate phosphatase|nr:HAD-IA family hydrolase [Acidobacteriaceae bacterium]